jgi:hypothetical protein
VQVEVSQTIKREHKKTPSNSSNTLISAGAKISNTAAATAVTIGTFFPRKRNGNSKRKKRGESPKATDSTEVFVIALIIY